MRIGVTRAGRLPERIPSGARIVVRTAIGVDPADGREKYRDYVGHVRAWDGCRLELLRDASAGGTRPAQEVTIHAEAIVALKPVPERRSPTSRRGGSAKPFT